MSRGHELWRKLALALGGVVALSVIVVSALRIHQKKQSADVFVTNDLEVAVDVSLGAAKVVVGPHTHTRLMKVPKGPQHLVVKRPDGRIIEDESVTIVGGAAATVVNVLGASPVYEETVFYASGPKPPDSKSTVFAGQTFVVRESADYVFVEPPATLSVDQSSGKTAKVHVGRFAEGLGVTLGYLGQNDPAKLAELLRTLALAEPEAERITSQALATFESPDAQLAFVEKLLAQRPDDIDLHRKRQVLLMFLGRAPEALSEYKARYDADPRSVSATYLYAAVLPRATARPILEKVENGRPTNPYVVRMLGAIAYQERRFVEAAGYLERIVPLADHHRVVLIEHTGAVLATEGPRSALEMLARLRPEERSQAVFWLVYGSVVARARAQGMEGAFSLDPLTVVDKAASNDDLGALYGEWGLEPPKTLRLDLATQSAIEIGLALRRDPAVAIDLFEKAAPQARTKLIGQVALALALEAGRTHRDSIARAAYAVAEDTFGKDPVLEKFVFDGVDDEALDGEPMSVRSLVELGRARRENDKKKRAVLEAQATIDDPLLGLTADAVKAWPAP